MISHHRIIFASKAARQAFQNLATINKIDVINMFFYIVRLRFLYEITDHEQIFSNFFRLDFVMHFNGLRLRCFLNELTL